MNRTLAVLLATLLVVSAVAPAGVAAQTDDEDEDSYFDGLVTEATDDGGFLDPVTWIKRISAVTSMGDRLIQRFTSDAKPAQTYANDAMAAFNTHNETLLTYANARLNVSSEYDVFAVEFQNRSGANATRYVVTDTAEGNYTRAEMVTPAEFEARNRTVDHTITFDWFVSRHAAAEVETVAEDLESGGDIGTVQKAKLINEYGSGISSGLWDGGESA